MQFKLRTFALIYFSYLSTYVYSNNTDNLVNIQQLQECKNIPAALERLSCYDSLLPSEIKVTNNKASIKAGGVAWNRAIEQEQNRNSSSTEFLTTLTEGHNPTILITTPALGYSAPRPILMFSCIDNITRLQVALPKPIKLGSVDVRLEADNNSFNSVWFVREDGFLLEASRGLSGIQEIQKLFGSRLLKIKPATAELNQLTFNIENLATEIEPLKKACHW